MNLEITVSKSELQNKLKAVSRVINPSNKVLPAHGNFLFEIGTEFDVTGADEAGNITVTVDCRFPEPEEKWSFLVDSKTTMDGLRELPEQPLTLLFEKNGSVYSTSILHQSGKYKIQTTGSELFSVVKNASTVSTLVQIKSEHLLHGIKSVYQFVATDDLRPIMTGIFVKSVSANLSFCASNSAIMAMIDFAPEGTQFNDFEFVIPAKLAKMIMELVSKEPEIDLEIGEKNVTVSFGDIRIVYRLIEGKYPNYRSIVPKNNDKLLIANTSDVTAALRRTSVFASSPSSPVRLHASKSKLNMINLESDINQFADENVAADYRNSDLVIGFATNSLMKCLETITTEDVRMSFSDPSRACLITPDDINLGLTVLIMPLTINV